MFQLYMSLFIAALFFALTPGILLRLPSGGSKVTVAATHAVVFAVVYHFTHKTAAKFFYGHEGFAGHGGSPASGKGSPASGMMPPMGAMPPMGGMSPMTGMPSQ
jgi:hypothetical protein